MVGDHDKSLFLIHNLYKETQEKIKAQEQSLEN